MKNFIEFKIPYANLTYQIPAEGVVFRSDPNQSAPIVLMRRGGSLVTLPPGQYQGNYESLPVLTITGEMEQALSAIGGGPRVVQGTQNDFAGLVPKTQETIIQNIAPNNPNGISIESSTNGVLNQSPSTEQAILNAGGTQAQANSLAAAAQQNQGQPYTQAQVQAANVPIPQKAVTPINQPAVTPVAQAGTPAPAPANQQTFTTPSGAVVNAQGQLVTTPAQSGAPAAQGSATQPPLPNVPARQDERLSQILANPNLTADQKRIIQETYNAAATNDTASANRFLNAFNASSEFSSPFFKTQVNLVVEALNRSLNGLDGDLEYTRKEKQQTLDRLRKDVSASKENLTLEEAQELKNLERALVQDLDENANALAFTGKTSSSIRSRTDRLLRESNEGLVESSKRKFSFQTGQLDRNLGAAETQTAAEIARLQDKATQQRIAQLREAETKVGSDALAAAGFSGNGLFGNIFGSIPTQQYNDAVTAGRSALGNPQFIF